MFPANPDRAIGLALIDAAQRQARRDPRLPRELLAGVIQLESVLLKVERMLREQGYSVERARELAERARERYNRWCEAGCPMVSTNEQLSRLRERLFAPTPTPARRPTFSRAR